MHIRTAGPLSIAQILIIGVLSMLPPTHCVAEGSRQPSIAVLSAERLAVPMTAFSPGAAFDDRPIRAQVTAVRKTVLSAEINGRVSQLTVVEGGAFKRGDVLAKIDCAVYRSQAAKAKAVVDAANTRYKTNKRLTELKTQGKLELELAAAELRKARADLRMIDTQVDKCVIKAPFDGRVSEKIVSAEQYVQSGTPMLKILDDSRLQVEFIAPSRYLRWLKPGAGFELAIDETGQTYSAAIQRFGADVDAVSQSIKVFAELDNPQRGLMAGMSGRVKLDHPETQDKQVSR